MNEKIVNHEDVVKPDAQKDSDLIVKINDSIDDLAKKNNGEGILLSRIGLKLTPEDRDYYKKSYSNLNDFIEKNIENIRIEGSSVEIKLYPKSPGKNQIIKKGAKDFVKKSPANSSYQFYQFFKMLSRLSDDELANLNIPLPILVKMFKARPEDTNELTT
ncbi:MAG: hypothetical protein AB3X44_19370 [Leptothrix sp. (in: b-proteobacteria)]